MDNKFNLSSSNSSTYSMTAITTTPGVITGTDAAEIITGTNDYESISAMGGDDIIIASLGGDYLDGGDGNDTIDLSGSFYTETDLTAGYYYFDGPNARYGNITNVENVIGGDNYDFIYGSSSNNIIQGGLSGDSLYGVGGADVFIFRSAEEANGDYIGDYSSDDGLDFRQITNLTWTSIEHMSDMTYIYGDINGDENSDFYVAIQGTHTQINGVNAPYNFPAGINFPPPPGPVAPKITIGSSFASESDGFMVYTVTRSGDLSAASSVDYMAYNNYSRDGYDFVPTSGKVEFAPGESTAIIKIGIIDDQVMEPHEGILVGLSNAVNGNIESGFGYGTIVDDDTIVAPSVSISNSTASEAEGEISFVVTRTGSLDVISTASYYLSSGTAAVGSDLPSAYGQIEFAIGESTKVIKLPIAFDKAMEGDETFVVNLIEGRNMAVGQGQATGTITNSIPPVEGSSGNDVLYGTVNSETMSGFVGNDIFYGSAGADTIDGGEGTDIVSYFASRGAVEINLGRNVQYGGDAEGDKLIGIERVAGSQHNDSLIGDDARNNLDGNVGDDVLNGKGGADALKGGGGNDVFVFDSATEANGDSIVDWNAGDRIDMSQVDFNAVIDGSQSFTFIDSKAFSKSAGELQLTNDGVNTFLRGDTNGDGKADFTVRIVGVHTELNGINASEPPIVIVRPTFGTEIKDVINGTKDSDQILALGGNDVIYGSLSGDFIDGGAGSDAVSYTSSNGAVNVDLSRMVQSGGHAEADALFGIERLVGSAFNDELRGDDGRNSLNGNRGDDIIEGRGGADTLTGGSGNDTFVFNAIEHIQGDIITDWQDGDKIDLSGIDAVDWLPGDQKFYYDGEGPFIGEAASLKSSNDGVNTYLSADLNRDGVADFTITIAGVHTFNPDGSWLIG